MKPLRIFVGSLSGAFWSALFGAILLWLDAYTNPASWYLGPVRNMAPIFAYAGAICGLAIGFVLGFLIGAIDRGKRFGALIGLGLGVIVAAYFFLDTPINSWDVRSIVLTMAFVPLGALSGLLTTIFTGRANVWYCSRPARRY